jgi:hypothetical protein
MRGKAPSETPCGLRLGSHLVDRDVIDNAGEETVSSPKSGQGNRDDSSHVNQDSQSEGISITEVSQGDRRWTFPNDFSGIRLFHAAIALAQPFTAEELQALGYAQAP